MLRKITMVSAAVGALAIGIPGLAQADKGGKPGKTHPTTSHKCMPHNVAYVEWGTVDANTTSTLAGSNGTWTGSLVVDVTKTNHAARGDKGKTITYTFAASTLRVRFDQGATGFTAGERVKLIGKLATVGKKCTPPTTPATPVIKKVIVHAAAK